MLQLLLVVINTTIELIAIKDQILCCLLHRSLFFTLSVKSDSSIHIHLMIIFLCQFRILLILMMIRSERDSLWWVLIHCGTIVAHDDTNTGTNTDIDTANCSFDKWDLYLLLVSHTVYWIPMITTDMFLVVMIIYYYSHTNLR